MEAEAELDGALSDKERKCEERLLDGNSEVVWRYSSPSLGCCSLYKISSSVSFPVAKLKNWTFGKEEVILEVLSRQKWEKRKLKITWCVYIYILGFQLFSQKYYKRWLNICALFLVYSQIWLNIPRDGFHFLLHLPMDDRHIGYEQIKKKHRPGAKAGEEL